MTIRNPFIDTKLEYESEPVIWFSSRCRRIADRGKSTFVSGTRGSGKTSILRALSARYISEVQTLDQQFDGKRLDWFGVYIRLQESFPDMLDSRSGDVLDSRQRSARTNLRFAIFSQYIELLFLSQLCGDLIALRQDKFIKFTSGSEFEAVQLLVGDLPALREYSQGKIPETLGDLDQVCRHTLNALFRDAIENESRIPRETLVSSVPGEMIAAAAKRIIPIVRGDRFRQGAKLRVKLLIDDCELLPAEHQTYLNTLIRNSAAPVSWVVAFVGNLYNTRATIRQNQMLSDADCEQELLDEVKESEFRSLCTRVASLRLYQALSPRGRAMFPDIQNCFKLDRRLGKVSLNFLIEQSAQKSLSPVPPELRERAQAWKLLLDRSNLSGAEREDLATAQGELPYTMVIAAEALGITVEEAEGQLAGERERKLFKRKIARKQRAAYFLLGRQLQMQMLLAGENIVLALSDGCIRDFLDIMKEIFDREINEAFEGALIKFVRSELPISILTQSASIYAASEAKVRSVSTIADPFGQDVSHLVEGLGRLTSELQSIKVPELGLFRINWPGMRQSLQALGYPAGKLHDIFRKAEIDGFLREVDEADRIKSRRDPKLGEFRIYRLHRRFAPAFRYSFRGPYEVFSLSDGALVELLVGGDQFSVSDWVRRMVSRGDSSWFSTAQRSLPLLGNDDDDDE